MGDLAAAFMLLTRLPVGWLARRHAPGAFGDSVWAYPLAGAAVGGVAAAIYAGCHRLGLPPAVCAVWALGGLVLASGAFHEDGLADTADGIGGGRTHLLGLRRSLGVAAAAEAAGEERRRRRECRAGPRLREAAKITPHGRSPRPVPPRGPAGGS